MKRILILSIALCIGGGVSAQWGKKVKGNGEVVTDTRSTGDYDAISVGGSFEVTLVNGREGEVAVTAEENLQEYIVTEVKNGTLVIKIENGVNIRPSTWKDGIKITVPVSEINAVSLSGSGEIKGNLVVQSEDFEASLSGSGDVSLEVESETLSVSMSGSGDIDLKGSTGRLIVQISGSGDIRAFDLEAEEVDAAISGSADIEVTVNKSLDARVSGSGNIRYRGNPGKINTKSSGSGDIVKG